MESSVASAAEQPYNRGNLAVAGIGGAVLFAFTGWIAQRLLLGDSPLTAVLAAVAGFAFFGWVAVLLLAVPGTLGALVLADAAHRRHWRRPSTAVAGAAMWILATALPAAVGTPLMAGSGFALPEVIPASTVAGLFAGYLVGRPRVTFTNAD